MAYRFWELCYMYIQLTHTYTQREGGKERGILRTRKTDIFKHPPYEHKQKGSRGRVKQQQQQNTHPKLDKSPIITMQLL